MNVRFLAAVALFLLPLFMGSVPTGIAATPEGEYAQQIADLESLLQSITNLKRMLTATQHLLQTPEAAGREAELRARAEELSRKIEEMEASFERLSTGVDPALLQEDKREEFDWHQQLMDLLGPLLREFRKVTARPREIERLKGNLETYESRRQVIVNARTHLQALLDHTTDPELMGTLNRMVRTWHHREQEMAASIAITHQQLALASSEKKSLSQSVKDLSQVFFKTRGKNLFIALLAFALVWLGLHYLHKLILRISPFHREGRSVPARAFDLFYIVFEVVFSFFVFVGVLYVLGDWVLLSLAVIFALGVAWASKQAFPRIRTEATLMLNFGTVREGELVQYNGIPYEVVSLNIQSRLQNKLLGGGYVRLHIRDLVDLRSRPIYEDEIWFPSQRGDWVLLSDNTFGQVVAQTPDMVQLQLRGGAYKFFKVQNYLGLSPVNLSHGFRISASFGLDYQHQALVTGQIPAIIREALVNTLTAEGYGESLQKVKVEFMTAGASSLDLALRVDFKGSEAFGYRALQRAIQRICVDTCNEHHWIIPFQQVTVHLAGKEGT